MRTAVLEEFTLTHTLRETDEYIIRRGHRNSDKQPVLTISTNHKPSAASVARLEHEYALRQELNSAGHAQALALIQHEDHAALVLSDTGGTPLDQLIEMPLAIPVFLNYALGMVRAVMHLHRQDIVHKDIKPANILIDPHSGEAKLIGLGVASLIPREQQAPLTLETASSSLPYMAPEQTGRMNRSIDARSDLYSLGVSFYQMLTGQLPFVAQDVMEWVHCHIARQPTPATRFRPDLPPPLAAMLAKLLAKTAEERYQSAAGIEADLLECQLQLANHGAIHDFAIGTHDVSGRLLIPEKLYGRAEQRSQLLQAVERVVNGSLEMVSVSGYSGIGKSALVNELHKAIIQPRAIFVAGKFDQFKRNIPYATLAAAFQTLVRQILAQSEEELTQWRSVLMQALGANGKLMLDIIPELKFIIGPQPAPVDLAPIEAQNRFQMVFRQFLGVCATPKHPLILFLDDMQWIDAASLQLLQHIMSHGSLQYFLLIGAWRDNEITPAHPLLAALSAVRSAHVPMTNLRLDPLAEEDVVSLLRDTVQQDDAELPALAQLVYDKTAGNPFFTIQFLTRLADEKLLSFDVSANRWRWDLSGIRAKGFTENVVDLMIDKLQSLPPDTLDALKVFAYLGNQSDVATLALVHGHAVGATHEHLWPAVRLGLVLRQGNNYRFQHDRVQEAAYMLTPEDSRPALHLQIGRTLLTRMTESAIEEEPFSLVNHFDRGIELITDQAERNWLRQLNMLAGKKAKLAVAYASAHNYFSQAITLLPENHWQECYQESFGLFLALAECEYLLGNYGAADQSFNLIQSHADSDLDQAKTTILRAALYQISGRLEAAVAALLQTLKLFGFEFPQEPDLLAQAIQHEQHAVQQALAGRNISDLQHLPEESDTGVRIVLELLSQSAVTLYLARPQLFPLNALKALNYSLAHGNSETSCYAYSYYAILLVSQGDINTAFEFSELAIRLNQRFEDSKRRGRLLFNHGNYVHVWRKPMAGGVDILQQGFVACEEAGDLVFACYCAHIGIWNRIENGDTLEQVLEAIKQYLPFVAQCQNAVVMQMLRLYQQFAYCLQGLTWEVGGFDDDHYSEHQGLSLLTQANFGTGITRYHIIKQINSFLFGDIKGSLASAQLAAERLHAVKSSLIEANHHFFYALAICADYGEAEEDVRLQYDQLLQRQLRKLSQWAQSCPENFANRYQLVRAEIDRIHQRYEQAMRHYEQAIDLSYRNNFVQLEALTHELAAQFYLSRGLERVGRTYLLDAHRLYGEWGASAKQRQLEKCHPGLAARVSNADKRNIQSVGQLDVNSVIKASQAVSSVLELNGMIETLLQIVVENAGAERGLLILPDEENGGYQIKACAQTSSDGMEVSFVQTPVSNQDLPEMLLQYVLRTHEKVLLDDAAGENPYSGDVYLSHTKPRSVLCLPLLKQGHLDGMLYLENRLTPGVFTPARIAVLEVLASQAAISLASANLLAHLQQENVERKRAEAALQQHRDQLEVKVAERTAELVRKNHEVEQQKTDLELAHNNILVVSEIGRKMTASLRRDDIISALCDHIGQLMDAAMLAIGFYDEDKQCIDYPYAVLDEVRLALRGEQMLREVQQLAWCCVLQKCEIVLNDVATELPQWLGEHEAPMLPDAADAVGHWPLPASVLYVPLLLKDRVLGLISVQSHAVNAYQPHHLNVMQTLAAYAAVALDNAQAYQRLQEAQKQLVAQEKMAGLGSLVAGVAHELNTPIGNCLLSSSVLLEATEGINAKMAAGAIQKTDLRAYLASAQNCSTIIHRGLTSAANLVSSFKQVAVDQTTEQKRVFDLRKTSQEIIDNLMVRVKKTSHSLHMDIPEGISLNSYPGPYGQVISNFINNALLHGFEDIKSGKMLLRAWPPQNGRVRIEFSDDGRGIPEAHLKRIFDPFFTTKLGQGGNGLGLSVSFNIVTSLLKGEITVESRMGAGTTFKLELPLQVIESSKESKA
ncbi:AAA family ATPase [Massilia sp. W12]|uniref:trifunctional serine/threonine-protein kinase/ATP-binding protein/sensor histidine kinase n=1 Tax=Massilia sp. W12 TaxID=3126507 RepID=UPI0030D25207